MGNLQIHQPIFVLTCVPKILIFMASSSTMTTSPVLLHAQLQVSSQILSQEHVYHDVIQVQVYMETQMIGDVMRDVPLDLAIL